jgi:hypothetical protein
MVNEVAVRADAASAAPSMFWRRLGRAAVWAVVIGIALEFALIALAASLQRMPEAARVVTQLTSKVTWSFIVCVGIVAGHAATKARGPIMGVLGLAFGPVAFVVARSVHKGLGQALSVDIAEDPTPTLWLGALKAVEYGAFGVWLARLTQQRSARLSKFLIAGITIGIVCGGIGVWLFAHAKPDATTFALLSRAVNEVVFPIGCAFVVYMATRLSAAPDG